MGGGTRQRRVRPPAVGDPAPPLEGRLLDGGSFRLADERRPVLVMFLRHAG